MIQAQKRPKTSFQPSVKKVCNPIRRASHYFPSFTPSQETSYVANW